MKKEYLLGPRNPRSPSHELTTLKKRIKRYLFTTNLNFYSNKIINQENMFMALRINNTKSVVKNQNKDNKEVKFMKSDELQKRLRSSSSKSKCLNVLSPDNMAFMMKLHHPQIGNVFSRLTERRSSKKSTTASSLITDDRSNIFFILYFSKLIYV